MNDLIDIQGIGDKTCELFGKLKIYLEGGL